MSATVLRFTSRTPDADLHPSQSATPTERNRHRANLAHISRVANASLPLEPTPQERMLLAIFGLKDGETVTEAVHEMRTAGLRADRHSTPDDAA